MRKTTVYVPDDLKAELSNAAIRTGRSEAELIREGIRIVTARAGGPEPLLPLFASDQPDLADHVDDHLTGFGQR